MMLYFFQGRVPCMALKINTQTNLNDMFDKFASIP
ncbi:hypothetical protein AAULR_10320, partial [Lacticaseibacillus rhamnosus MTCC 5462]